MSDKISSRGATPPSSTTHRVGIALTMADIDHYEKTGEHPSAMVPWAFRYAISEMARVAFTRSETAVPEEREAIIEWIECEEFYNLMQSYRYAQGADQSVVMAAYRAVKGFIADEILEDRRERTSLSAIAEKNPDPGTEKLLRDMLDRAYKMMQMAGYRVVEQDPDSNNPIIAWMADARSVLYGGTKPHPDPENLT